MTTGEWGDEYPSLRLVGGSIERTAEAYMERTVYGEVDPAVAKANARLIAAAPDLLEALQWVTTALEQAEAGYPDKNADQATAFAHAAIAKAKGAA